MPPTYNLGPCNCCSAPGSSFCPVFCDIVATVNGLTVDIVNFQAVVTDADGVTRQLFFASQGGVSYFPDSPPANLVTRAEALLSSGITDNDPDGPACVTEFLHTGPNAAQLIANEPSSIIYSSTRARPRNSIKQDGFIVYFERNFETLQPNWAAIWPWDWDSDGGVLFTGSVGGTDSDGNAVETLPTLELTVDARMPLACLPDDTCQELSPGEVTSYPVAWNCDCCGQSVSDPGCGQCDNPLP